MHSPRMLHKTIERCVDNTFIIAALSTINLIQHCEIIKIIYYILEFIPEI